VIVDGGTFNYEASGRFPAFTNRTRATTDSFSPNSRRRFSRPLRAQGSVQYLPTSARRSPRLTPSSFIQGLETLSYRMERHVQNAVVVANWLEARATKFRGGLPGLASSPWHERQLQYLPRGGGSIIAFGIKGGLSAGQKFIEGLELFSHLANVGDVRSLAIHPASTTHSAANRRGADDDRCESDLVRLSVGLETIDDILADLDAGFLAAKDG